MTSSEYQPLDRGDVLVALAIAARAIDRNDPELALVALWDLSNKITVDIAVAEKEEDSGYEH